jgi:hypothetical protein
MKALILEWCETEEPGLYIGVLTGLGVPHDVIHAYREPAPAAYASIYEDPGNSAKIAKQPSRRALKAQSYIPPFHQPIIVVDVGVGRLRLSPPPSGIHDSVGGMLRRMLSAIGHWESLELKG